ncbi:MAG TPA: VOC family protein [Glaciibacter sp.]|nr:VOC family protein [Glaciibacter sp.]
MVNYKFEVAVLPVSDVVRARTFYEKLGWRLDIYIDGENGSGVAQLTPTGSPASIIISRDLTDAAAGTSRGFYLIVEDVEEARADIAGRGVAISEVFHEANGGVPSANLEGRIAGLAPERASYLSFATFSDPDGNEWILQEITTRLPGRV